MGIQRQAYLRSALADAAGSSELSWLGEVGPEQVTELGGGVDAATYLVRAPGQGVVVKLNDGGLEAEAEALRAWAAHTDRVPEVLALGAVSVLPSGDGPVRYLVLRAMTDADDEIVRTGADYLDDAPSGARELGRALGAELSRMHRAENPHGFGNFADSPGADRTYEDWGAYLADFFDQHTAYVRGLGVPEREVDAVRRFLRSCTFTGAGRYLHGDVTIRNVAIYQDRPLRVGLFDPNPVVGDPAWDLAPLANNVEFDERSNRRDGAHEDALRVSRDLLAGVRETYAREVTDDALLPAQLVQAVLQAEHRQARHDEGETDRADVEVTDDFIRTAVDAMASA